jgi:ATP-binding cassette, subfamily C (CFTR/MRP), member 4
MLCLARILLSNNKFLILDEATSNLDPQTDAYINRIIHEKFKDATVLAVAHRLDTVVDYDKILVVEKGLIVEEGDPYELVRDKGRFYNMIQHSGKSESENILRAIRNKYKAKRISIQSTD